MAGENSSRVRFKSKTATGGIKLYSSLSELSNPSWVSEDDWNKNETGRIDTSLSKTAAEAGIENEFNIGDILNFPSSVSILANSSGEYWTVTSERVILKIHRDTKEILDIRRTNSYGIIMSHNIYNNHPESSYYDIHNTTWSNNGAYFLGAPKLTNQDDSAIDITDGAPIDLDLRVHIGPVKGVNLTNLEPAVLRPYTQYSLDEGVTWSSYNNTTGIQVTTGYMNKGWKSVKLRLSPIPEQLEELKSTIRNKANGLYVSSPTSKMPVTFTINSSYVNYYGNEIQLSSDHSDDTEYINGEYYNITGKHAYYFATAVNEKTLQLETPSLFFKCKSTTGDTYTGFDNIDDAAIGLSEDNFNTGDWHTVSDSVVTSQFRPGTIFTNSIGSTNVGGWVAMNNGTLGEIGPDGKIIQIENSIWRMAGTDDIDRAIDEVYVNRGGLVGVDHQLGYNLTGYVYSNMPLHDVQISVDTGTPEHIFRLRREAIGNGEYEWDTIGSDFASLDKWHTLNNQPEALTIQKNIIGTLTRFDISNTPGHIFDLGPDSNHQEVEKNFQFIIRTIIRYYDHTTQTYITQNNDVGTYARIHNTTTRWETDQIPLIPGHGQGSPGNDYTHEEKDHNWLLTCVKDRIDRTRYWSGPRSGVSNYNTNSNPTNTVPGHGCLSWVIPAGSLTIEGTDYNFTGGLLIEYQTGGVAGNVIPISASADSNIIVPQATLQDGDDASTFATGGAAGPAIVGSNNVTIRENAGNIYGSQV